MNFKNINTKLVAKILIILLIALSSYDSQIFANTPTIKAINNIGVTINQGQKYTLPTTVKVIMSNNTTKLLAVKWTPNVVNTNITGSYNYYGTVKSYSKKVLLKLNIKLLIVPVETFQFSVKLGEVFSLPKTIKIKTGSGEVKSISITWDTNKIDTNKAGTFYYYGTIANYSFRIPLKLSVTSNISVFYIKSLNDYENAIKTGLESFMEKITLKFTNYSDSVYKLNKVNEILDNNPNLDYGYDGVNSNIEWLGSKSTSTMTLNFKYTYSKDEMVAMKNATEKKASEIIAKLIKENMKDFEKELAIHDYVVNNTVYDIENFSKGNTPKIDHIDYGVLIKGIGVCEGYAKAIYRLLNMAGVECLYITGIAAGLGETPIEHAWNLVKIGGDFYHLDATFDDPVTENNKQTLSHTYFNLTDIEIKTDHAWEYNSFPKCIETVYKFDKLNVPEKDSDGDLIITIQNYNEFYTAIKKAIDSKAGKVSLKIRNYDNNIYSMDKVIDAVKYYGSVNWTYSDDKINNSRYMKIYFK